MEKGTQEPRLPNLQRLAQKTKLSASRYSKQPALLLLRASTGDTRPPELHLSGSPKTVSLSPCIKALALTLKGRPNSATTDSDPTEGCDEDRLPALHYTESLLACTWSPQC